MRDVKLYGHLGKRYGKLFRLDVASPAEAIRALKVQLAGFEQEMVKDGRSYHVFVGNQDISEAGLTLQSHNLPIKIVPVVAGAGGKGVLQTIVGATLIAIGLFTGFQPLVSIGASLVLGGVAQMLTPNPKAANLNSADSNPSYSFNGPVNTTAQGNPVPILYGRLIVGSQVISVGLSVEQLR